MFVIKLVLAVRRRTEGASVIFEDFFFTIKICLLFVFKEKREDRHAHTRSDASAGTNEEDSVSKKEEDGWKIKTQKTVSNDTFVYNC